MQRRTVGIMRRVQRRIRRRFAPFASFGQVPRVRATILRIMRRNGRGLTNLLKLL